MNPTDALESAPTPPPSGDGSNAENAPALPARAAPAPNPPPPETAVLRLDDWGSLGDALADFEGARVNVFGGIVGERVRARIVRYRRRRRQHVAAIVSDVLEPSPHRVAPPCAYFGACTGCQWQHIDYAHQLTLKRQFARREFAAYPELQGVEIADTLPSPQTFGYRNHARFTARQGDLGFVNRLTRRFVKVDECMLMHPWINGALAAMQGKAGETTQLSARCGVNTGDWLIQPTMQNPDIPLPTGQTHYWERMLHRRLRVASPSFAQVNTPQAERLAELVRARLGLSGDELLVDAYAGVGTFAALLADSARRVIAIEESSAAVKDAAVNIAGIDNIDFVEGRTEDVIDGLPETPDAVILDPPRVGCHAAALQALSRSRPRRVVYVSCDPATLARDLATLTQGGFAVTSVDPLDMFPQTHHVECVAALEPA